MDTQGGSDKETPDGEGDGQIKRPGPFTRFLSLTMYAFVALALASLALAVTTEATGEFLGMFEWTASLAIINSLLYVFFRYGIIEALEYLLRFIFRE